MAAGRMAGPGALALALVATPLAGAPVAQVSALPEAAQVLDIRAEDTCARASLPGARCLPAGWLFAAEGGPIDFGSLRWLLGTLGLTGAETLAIWPADMPGAFAVAGLIQLAGQRAVVVYDGPTAPAGRGETRSFSREAVFTAPMRTGALTVAGAAPATPLAARLDAYARGLTETVAYGPAD
jgi:hypothetical protein